MKLRYSDFKDKEFKTIIAFDSEKDKQLCQIVKNEILCWQIVHKGKHAGTVYSLEIAISVYNSL